MTLVDLAESGPFQALFEFQFGEEYDRGNRWSPVVDLLFLRPVRFTFEANSGSHYKGRFLGEAETTDGAVGDVTGTFCLHLPRGLDGGEAHHIIDSATLKITIENVPGW